MNLTDSQNNKLESYKHSLSLDTKKQRVLLNQLEDVNKRIKSSERVIKYLQALRDADLQGQVEAKLGWELFEPIKFLYEGKLIEIVYSGVWNGYDNGHIRLNRTQYSLKQIIEENITNNDTNTDTPT